MYVVIVGAGMMGLHIARMMSNEGHDVVIVEQSEARMQLVNEKLDVKTVLGGAVNPSTLYEAEVRRADIVIALTNSDEANIVICFLAKQMGASKTVARVRNPEYSGYIIAPTATTKTTSTTPIAPASTTTRRVIRPKNLGIDLIVNPELVVADEVARILSNLYAAPTEYFADGQILLSEYKVSKETIFNKQIQDLDYPGLFVVAAIERGTEVIIPKNTDIIKEGDRVYIVSSRNDMDKVGALFAQPRGKAGSTVIIGGGSIGVQVASRLENDGIHVKVIEEDAKRCWDISQKLKHSTIIQGEGSDYTLLIQEGVASADSLICSTERSELNILIGLLGKNLGIPRIISLVDRQGFVTMAETMGIDIALAPLELTAGKIARLSRLAEVISVAILANQRVEAIEMIAAEKAEIINKPLGNFQLPAGAKIAAYTHENTVHIPQKESIIQPGDHVVVVCLTSASSSIEKLF